MSVHTPYQKHTWVTKEIIRREYLQNIEDGIYQEQQDAEAAETALENALEAEKQRARSSETTIQNNLTAEVTRATAAEEEITQGIQDDLDELSERISNEYTRATTAETAIQDSIDTNCVKKTDYATTTTPGIVRPDGTTITIDSDGTIHGQAQGSGHIIVDSSGTELTSRSKLKFLNATVTDDSTNDQTIVTPTGTQITVDTAMSSTSTNPVQNKVINSSIETLTNNVATNAAAIAKCEMLEISVASFNALPHTITNSDIEDDMKVVNSVLSNSSAQLSDWTVTTSSGSLTISGSINGTTTAILYLMKSR